MAHIIRFSIVNDQDRRVALDVCRRFQITPEEFAKSAFFEAVNEAVRLLNERDAAAKSPATPGVPDEAAMSPEEKAELESKLGVESNGQAASGNTEGTTPEVQLGEGSASDPLATSSEPSAESAT